MSGDGSGRVTTRPYVTAAIVAVALAVVYGVSSLSSGGGEPASPTPATTPPTNGIREAALTGRLLFAAHSPDGVPGLRERLYTYDLFDRTISAGPKIPTARSLTALADGSILILSDGSGGMVVPSLAPPVDRGATLRHLPEGSVVTTSPDDRQVAVLSAVRRQGCSGPAVAERDFRFVIGSPDPLESRSPARCGGLVSGAAGASPTDATVTAISVVDDRGRVRTLIGEERVPQIDGAAIVSIGPERTALLVRLERPIEAGVPPVGQLLVWPFAGDPRPAVDGLVATRVLAWSPDGAHAVVNAAYDGVRAMWLIDPAGGTAEQILPGDGVELGTAFSGATFDDVGDAFGASAAGIVVVTPTGTFPIELPEDAPVPSGPIVWLP